MQDISPGLVDNQADFIVNHIKRHFKLDSAMPVRVVDFLQVGRVSKHIPSVDRMSTILAHQHEKSGGVYEEVGYVELKDPPTINFVNMTFPREKLNRTSN